MSKVMETRPLLELLGRIAGEYRAEGSIYGIPEKAFREGFELEASSPGLEVMGGKASLPVGPAAGPHSQSAPNLVAAYLCGSRAFELKTVQANDALDIAKPCIDALDEGYNVEWSTELSLAEAREEYLRGWIAVNLLAALFSPRPRDFFFNISVGYTLEGIKSPKVDFFLEGMRDPAGLPFWRRSIEQLESFVEGSAFRAAFGPAALERARSLLQSFPSSPLHSVTLSTMHGCPPEEIERIGAYLLEQKGLDAFVKLNPTLLGYDEVRGILNATGWTGIEISRESFERDLQMKSAVALASTLSTKAKASGRRFGIKLSNTLANRNEGSFLPGEERYLSGRALFPITARLAARLADELAGLFPALEGRFSYCGGVWALNAAELVAAGLGPLTLATDILKPGGYLRLIPVARAAASALAGSSPRPDPAALASLADAALERPEYRFGWKSGKAAIPRPLPLVDCFAAPCVEACPVRQDAPAYLRLGGEGAAREALETIISDNPLPFITGTLCDHVCQAACSRNDYEGSVEIRAAKLACARAAEIPPPRPAPSGAYRGRAAVVGAGPAGLACAHHLALAGIPVTVFEEAPGPGGVPANVIPRFRIKRQDISKDVDRIAALGAEFRFGTPAGDLGQLRAAGYNDIFVAAGAPVPRRLDVEGEGVRLVDALAFLEESQGKASAFAGSKRVVVAGGGNTAMDAARVALRIEGIGSVSIAYRRGRAEMPADREEFETALAEGAALFELALPERALPGEGGRPPRLVFRRMRLGPKDGSGRPSPLPSDESFELDCDLLVAAVGEVPDRALLEGFGIACGSDGRPVVDPETQASGLPGVYVGGDAARGPSSIIAAEADGRRAAYAIMKGAGIEPPRRRTAPVPPNASKLASRGELAFPLGREEPGFLRREAERCLACDSACLRCVEVCPNRANIAIAAGADPFSQPIQILHDDELCNECGNCGVFCPFEGEPYRGKPTLFGSRDALVMSHNAGYYIEATGARTAGAAGRTAGAAGRTAGAAGRTVISLRAEPEGPVIDLDRAGWEADRGAMAALARVTLRERPYLLPGGRE